MKCLRAAARELTNISNVCMQYPSSEDLPREIKESAEEVYGDDYPETIRQYKLDLEQILSDIEQSLEMAKQKLEEIN